MNVQKPVKVFIQTAAVIIGIALLGYALLITAWMTPTG
jgi:CHASE2 domain-containing sensor protein